MDAPSFESGIFLARRRTSEGGWSDAALVELMIADHPAAWREFRRRSDRLIHRCITKVTRRFAAVITYEDIREMHAIFLLSLVANDKHKLRSFDAERGSSFASWIGLLATNCAYDYLRTLKGEPVKMPLADAVDLACEMPDPFERAVESQRAEIAEKALRRFSAKDRAFAELYFGEGRDPVEIARLLGISVKTVYSKKHKIRLRLEALLGWRRRKVA